MPGCPQGPHCTGARSPDHAYSPQSLFAKRYSVTRPRAAFTAGDLLYLSTELTVWKTATAPHQHRFIFYPFHLALHYQRL